MLSLQHCFDVAILANTWQFSFNSLNLLIVGDSAADSEKEKENGNDGVLVMISEGDEKKKKKEKKEEKKNENKNELNDSSL